MTVRDWFRADRAAMWRDPSHPAHGVAREIDGLAAAVVAIAAVSEVIRGHAAVETFALAWPFAPGEYTLWLPVRDVRDMRAREAAAALHNLLEIAEPEHDRRRFRPNWWD